MEDQFPRLLPGMRDRGEEEVGRLQEAQTALLRLMRLYGYRPVDTPILEPTELFLRKSGGELASRLYTFTEPGGRRVSLRPEMTSSVIRAFVEGHLQGPLPQRWCYAGPVFRYLPEASREPRQFTQVGAELLGASGPDADAEVASLALHCARALGIGGVRLALGHLGVLQGLFSQFCLSERAVMFLLESVPALRRGEVEAVRERGRALGLLQAERRGPALEALLQTAEAEALLQDSLTAPGERPTWGRSPEEILHRLLQKLQGAEEPGRVEQALAFAASLARVNGPPEEALGQAREVVRSFGLDPTPLGEVEALLESLSLHHLGDASLWLDLGLARGLAYYTGVVFEVEHPSLGKGLGGGGRYDGLVRALGGTADVPAMGFALSLERLLEVSRGVEALPPPSGRLLLAPETGGALRQALQHALALRGEGWEVEFWPQPAPLEALLHRASLTGAERVVTVSPRGETRSHPIERSGDVPAPGRPQRR